MRPKTSPSVTVCWRQRSREGGETIESQRWRQWDAEIQGAALSGAWELANKGEGNYAHGKPPGGVVQHFRGS